MTHRLKLGVTKDVTIRLAQVKGPAIGCLFGHFFNNTILIVGFSTKDVPEETSSDEENVGHDKSFCKLPPGLLYELPTEVDMCGVVSFGSKLEDKKINGYFTTMVQDVDITDNPVLLTCEGDNILAYMYVNQKLEKISYVVYTQAQIAASFINLRLRAVVPISFESNSHAVQEAFAVLRNKVVDDMVAFQLPQTNILLTGNDAQGGILGVTPDHMIKDLLDSQGVNKRDDPALETFGVRLLLKQTQDIYDQSTPASAPVIHQKKREFNCIKLSLHIDGMSLVNRSTRVADLYNILVSSFCRNMRLLENSLLAQLEKGVKISVPELFHFLPPNFSHFITTAYPKSDKDSVLRPDRIALHNILGLPVDRPLFRRSMAYTFPEDQIVKGPLINPHEGLNSGVKGGEPSLVQGLYYYHHYMQDRFDDNGWGCAYRSLQTIVSWFRLQGYTEVKVPTHKQIQDCLVRIGDKPASFVGSRQWIGSTEVSFVLESMLGVTCRILTASNGEEMASLGSELSYHFKMNGTPVMIGGGVLAHTIIGIDYNRSTGDIKYLILDPHYTGGEDRNIITSKGWVGWKDTKFWSKNAFYNMCLPMRPVGDV